VLWNTVYLDRAIATLNSADTPPSPELLRYVSPLSWEHINLTGNYTWPRATHKPGTYRPLRRSRDTPDQLPGCSRTRTPARRG
jgi:hypothetical protein